MSDYGRILKPKQIILSILRHLNYKASEGYATRSHLTKKIIEAAVRSSPPIFFPTSNKPIIVETLFLGHVLTALVFDETE